MALIPTGMDLNSSFFFSGTHLKHGEEFHVVFIISREILLHIYHLVPNFEKILWRLILLPFDVYLLVVECTVNHLSASISCFFLFLILEAGRVHLVNITSSSKFGDNFQIDIIYKLFERDWNMFSDCSHYCTMNREYSREDLYFI